jgi:hypothetical protein
MRLRNDLIDEKDVMIGEMAQSGQGLPAANLQASIRLRNEIAATAKSKIWQNLFSAPVFHAAGGGAPKPSVSGDESDTKYLLLQPE